MRKSKAGIFTLSSSSLIVCECLITIVIIFLDTFLVSKLLHLTPGDYTGVSFFNFIYYIMIAFAAFALSPLLRKINKSFFLSLGAVLLAGLFITVYLLGDNIASWIWVLGVASGLGTGIFNCGFNNLVSEVVSSKHQTIYFSVKNIIVFLTKTVFPLILGSIIDLGSFPLLCVIIAVICILIFIFSFLIKTTKKVELSYNLPKFWKLLKENKEETKPLKTLYLSAFFRGFCFNLISTAFTVLIFLNVGAGSGNTDFMIGLIQTIFTASQLISMFIFMKTYHKNRSKWFLFGALSVILAASIPVFITRNIVTILIFFGIYTFFRLFITTVSDMRRPSVIRLLSMHTHTLEHNTTYEIIQGVSRSTSYLLFLLCLVLPEYWMIEIILGVNLLAYVGYTITLFVLEKQLIVQDINWKNAHPIINPTQQELPKVIEAIPEKVEGLPKIIEKI